MEFNLSAVPFSRYGSYTIFSWKNKKPGQPAGVYLRDIHSATGPSEIFHLELIRNGRAVPYAATAKPELLTLTCPSGKVEICMPGERVVRIRGRGAGLRLTLLAQRKFENALPATAGAWRVNCRLSGVNFLLTPLRGHLAMDAPWRGIHCEKISAEISPNSPGEDWELAVEPYLSTAPTEQKWPGFDESVASVQQELRNWRKNLPAVPNRYEKSAELASYILWSCVVAPGGFFRRPAMLMSKNWMTAVWSWDHCFNAMALAAGNPDLAWDQLMVLFDLQDEHGAIPDSVRRSQMIWNFCKPPIHGWALRWMMKHSRSVNAQRLKEIYMPLARWTNWWFRTRDDDGDGLPQYNHGNDCGWDNATPFAIRPPIEGPDLAAYLAIQMDVLTDVTRRLKKPHIARLWNERAEEMVRRLMEHNWRDGRFVAPQSGTHKTVSEGDSLLPFMPLVLGKRLPADVRKKLLAGLKIPGRFLTRHGLATESPKSPLYESDGYWRGPIWAPSTMLVVDGLESLGEKTFARVIAKRFCDLCAASGFAENFDALTGKGLRDRAYTWTASVFFLLARSLRGK
jgi:glycogen debranching enzyme